MADPTLTATPPAISAQAGINALGGGKPTTTRDLAMKQYLDIGQQRQAALKDSATASRKRAEEISQLSAVPIPPPNLGTAPPHPAKPDFSHITELSPIWAVLAAVGGIGTRRPMVTAMQAMAGAMQGYESGNLEQYQLKRQEYKDAMEEYLDKSRNELAKYKAIVDNRKLTLMEKNQAGLLQAKADGNEDKAQSIIQLGLIHTMADDDKQRLLLQKAEQGHRKNELEFDKLEETKRLNDARIAHLQGGGTGTSGHTAQQFQADGELFRAAPGGGLEKQAADGSWEPHKGPIPKTLQKLGSSSGRATVSANTAAGRYETLALANDEIDKLEGEGVLRLPILADAYADGKGLGAAYVRYAQQQALNEQEQRLFAATQLAAETIGHSVAGARMSDEMFSRMMTQFVPMPGNTQSVTQMKREHRYAQQRAMLIGSGVNKDQVLKGAKDRAPENPYLNKAPAAPPGVTMSNW